MTQKKIWKKHLKILTSEDIDGIKKLRGQGLKLDEIAEQYDRTMERIRQVIVGSRYCGVHQRKYVKSCHICTREKKYKKFVDILIRERLFDELERLRKKDRRKEIVIERTIFVKKLKDKYGMSFTLISYLFGYDHSSIINLYRK